MCNALSVIVWNQINAYKGFRLRLNWLVFQVQTDIGVDTKHQTLQGVAFPIAKEAIQALEKLKNKKLNYVQLASIKYFNYFLIVSIKYITRTLNNVHWWHTLINYHSVLD